MKLKKSKLFVCVFIAVILIAVLIVSSQFIFGEKRIKPIVDLQHPNFVEIQDSNYVLNLDKVDEIEISSPAAERNFKSDSEEYQKTINFFSNLDIHFYEPPGVLWDGCDYEVTLKNSKKTATYCFYPEVDNGVLNNKVMVVIVDFYAHRNISYQLDYRYFLVSEISIEQFKTIFPDFDEEQVITQGRVIQGTIPCVEEKE